MARRRRKPRRIGPGDLPCRFTVFFDGCCEPRNPGGNAGYGCVILADRAKVYEHSGFIPAAPETSNNVAEYLAFSAALNWLAANNHCGESIQMFGDSKLVIEQMFGSWKIHGIDTNKKPAGRYADFAVIARRLLARFSNISGYWIPREKNFMADDLSKRELRSRGVKFKIQPE